MIGNGFDVFAFDVRQQAADLGLGLLREGLPHMRALKHLN
jgi:hypothetical protein